MTIFGSQRLKGRDDDELLLLAMHGNDSAFSVFYERNRDAVLAYFKRRVAGRADVALDLTAETFAQLVSSLRRFDQGRGSALAFLFGIAANVLRVSLRQGSVQDEARRQLQLQVVLYDDEDLAYVDRAEASIAEDRLNALLSLLPASQREAVLGRVVDEQDYDELAARLDCSVAVAQQRVSRGLKFMRTRLEAQR